MSTAAPLDYVPTRTSPPFFRLSLMMFLQYAVWGVWLPILSSYVGSPVSAGGLGFSAFQVGALLGVAASLGAVLSPFIAGQLADRVMNAERALGLLLLIGGVLQIFMTWQTGFVPWLILLTIYSIVYMPTLALTNSIAFANLTDREKQFPPIRTFGTIGWIVASVAFALVYLQSGVGVIGTWPFLGGVDRADAISQMKYAMFVAGIVSIGYAIFSFVGLPATPPNRDTKRPLAFAAAFKLITRPSVIALLVAALLVSMIHQVYFMQMGPFIQAPTGIGIGLGGGDVGPVMAIGQVSEIVFLALLGFCLKRIGYKWIIVLGALSYAVRYGYFATVPDPSTLKIAMLLHGMNYGFFFAGAFLFIEKISPPDIRHSTQTAFGIVILGLGPILAFFYNGVLAKIAVRSVDLPLISGTETVVDFGKLWAIQASIAFLAGLVLIFAFPARQSTPVDTFDDEREVEKVAP